MGDLTKKYRTVRFVVTFLITIFAALIALFGILAYQSSSLFAKPATCVSDRCFCETPSINAIAQPVDTVTSLAFVIGGAWAIFAWLKFKKATKERRLVAWFAAVFIFIGLSSFFYHGTLSYLGQFLDVFSMYIFGILLALGALIRRNQLTFGKAALLFIIFNVIFGILQYYYPESRRLLFGLLLIPGLLLEQLPKTTGFKWFSKQVRYLYVGVILLIVAYGFWILDQYNIVCWPTSIIQGHAIWHILTAIAAYMIILHYRATSHPLNKK